MTNQTDETTYYFYDANKNEVITGGALPEVWGRISGITPEMLTGRQNFGWADPSYEGLGYYTEAELKAKGIDSPVFEIAKNKKTLQKWMQVRQLRDLKIKQIMWRVERYQQQGTLGIVPTESLGPILDYIQSLRDITKQTDPDNIVWPNTP